MLAKFTVSHFKSFQQHFELDLSQPGSYEFHPECIRNGVVNTALLYGPNGCGKSNLGFAMFDIIQVLTNKYTTGQNYQNYLNALAIQDLAEFEFEFHFGNHRVNYRYGKSNYETLVYENFCINGKEWLRYDRRSPELGIVLELGFAQTLNTAHFLESKLSLLKYIHSNTLPDQTLEGEIFGRFFAFVEGMIHYRGLDDRFFQGFDEAYTSNIVNEIFQKEGALQNFEAFLHQAQIPCQLVLIERGNALELYFQIANKKVKFEHAASTGTKSLLHLYFCLHRIEFSTKPASLLFIDEFDAYYHREVSEWVVNRLKNLPVQCVLTTHNTALLNHDLLRPDCCFEMNSMKIAPLNHLTDKELRRAHNLEKMYRAGSFRHG